MKCILTFSIATWVANFNEEVCRLSAQPTEGELLHATGLVRQADYAAPMYRYC